MRLWRASCDSSAKDGISGFAAVIYSPEGWRSELWHVEACGCNYHADLRAVMLAIRAVPEGESLIVVTDCWGTYCVLARGRRGKKWRKMIAKIRREMRRRDVRVLWRRRCSTRDMDRAHTLARLARMTADKRRLFDGD